MTATGCSQLNQATIQHPSGALRRSPSLLACLPRRPGRELLIPHASRQPASRQPLRTPDGHALPEVVSALQKAIRRGHEDDALYWAKQMDDGGFGAYAWRRLLIIVSEDVGLAWPTGPAVIRSLYATWAMEQMHRPQMMLVHAVLLLVRAPKSRLVDHALIAGGTEPRQVPDEALDMHTERGRAMGRSDEHWWNSAGLVADPKTGELTPSGTTIPDPYLDRARGAHKEDR